MHISDKEIQVHDSGLINENRPQMDTIMDPQELVQLDQKNLLLVAAVGQAHLSS